MLRPRPLQSQAVGLRRRMLSTASGIAVLLVVGCHDGGATAEERVAADPAMQAIDAFIRESEVDTSRSDWRTRLRKPPKIAFDPARKYFWKLSTNQGDMVFSMRTDVAPRHVASTFYLTRLGFYDGLRFHRVLQGFMAQGGDPLGNGRGGPGYKYAGEFDASARHDGPGVLSMANAGPGTDGSQFFITFKATPSLDDRHTVFGKAEDAESLATIRKLESLGAQRAPGTPSSPIVIERATILVE